MNGVAIRLNGEQRRVQAATIADLVAELGLAGRTIAVERNGEVAPRSRWDAIRLSDGDRIEIVQMIGGG